MPGQAGRRRAPHRDGAQCPMARDGVIHSQMPPFQPGDSVLATLFCKATRQPLTNLVQHGYNLVSPLGQCQTVRRPFVPRPPAPSGTGHYEGKRQRLLNRIKHWQQHFLSIGSVRMARVFGIYCSQSHSPICCSLPLAHNFVGCCIWGLRLPTSSGQNIIQHHTQP